MIKNVLLLGGGLCSLTLCAQLTAGEVPPGFTALDLNIHLHLTAPNTMDSASLEVDCDDFPDLQVILINGQPEVDGPSYAMLRPIDGDLEICADGINWSDRPQYYSFGQQLQCTGAFDWHTDELINLGDVGTFGATGPISVDSMYVAFRRGTTVGWILLSFNLMAEPGSWLQVHRVLSLCGSTGIDPNAALPAVSLFPNPTEGEAVRIDGTHAGQRLELLDAAGRVVARYGGALRVLPAPPEAGAYLLKVVEADGRYTTARLLRQ